ncbi:hypothetical protein [Spirosoma flavus]
MIDYRISSWINCFLSATQLVTANAALFTQRSRMVFNTIVQRLAGQTGQPDRYIFATRAVSQPLFYPNCYPFRHPAGASFLLVCAHPLD